MVSLAPRLGPRLLAEIERLAASDRSFAEITRRVGNAADRLGVARPSYETVRVLVRAMRELNAGPSTLEVLTDVALRTRPPQALLEHAAGIPLPPSDPARRRR
jgi:hypothetical protein